MAKVYKVYQHDEIRSTSTIIDEHSQYDDTGGPAVWIYLASCINGSYFPNKKKIHGIHGLDQSERGSLITHPRSISIFLMGCLCFYIPERRSILQGNRFLVLLWVGGSCPYTSLYRALNVDFTDVRNLISKYFADSAPRFSRDLNDPWNSQVRFRSIDGTSHGFS